MKGAEEGYTHCGNPKHTRETYFKLHGYPECSQDLKKKHKADTSKSTEQVAHSTGQVILTESELSLVLSNESPATTTKLSNG